MKRKEKRHIVPVAAALAAALAIGCGDDTNGTAGSGGAAGSGGTAGAGGVGGSGGAPPVTTIRGSLSGSQEVPSNESDGTGSVELTIDDNQTEIQYTLRYEDTATVTQAHIHLGAVGENGPVLLWLCESEALQAPDELPTPPECPASPGEVSGTLTAADLNPNPDSGIDDFEDAVEAILDGDTYVNVHSTAFVPGEVRGQLGAAETRSVLSGLQEVPVVVTDGTGSATLILNETQDAIDYTLEYTDTDAILQAHIHEGAAGTNGGILLFLCANGDVPVEVPDTIPAPPACPAVPGTVSGRLTEADFLPTDDVTTFEQAVNTMLSGNTYINVHSETVLSGEIRGQIGAAELDSVLSGDQEVPPVVTDGSGTATLRLNGTQTAASYSLSYADTDPILQAHIHEGAAGTNGGILLFLCANGDVPVEVPDTIPTPPACPAVPGTVGGRLTEADLLPTVDVTTFGQAVNAMLSGNTYINVHSETVLSGEIRGQIGNVEP